MGSWRHSVTLGLCKILTCFALVVAGEARQRLVILGGLGGRGRLLGGAGVSRSLGSSFSLACAGEARGQLTGGSVVLGGAFLCVALGVEALDVVLELDFAGLVNPGLDYN